MTRVQWLIAILIVSSCVAAAVFTALYVNAEPPEQIVDARPPI